MSLRLRPGASFKGVPLSRKGVLSVAVTRSKAKAKGILKRPAAAAISSMSEVEDAGSPIVEPLEESEPELIDAPPKPRLPSAPGTPAQDSSSSSHENASAQGDVVAVPAAEDEVDEESRYFEEYISQAAATLNAYNDTEDMISFHILLKSGPVHLKAKASWFIADLKLRLRQIEGRPDFRFPIKLYTKLGEQRANYLPDRFSVGYSIPEGSRVLVRRNIPFDAERQSHWRRAKRLRDTATLASAGICKAADTLRGVANGLEHNAGLMVQYQEELEDGLINPQERAARFAALEDEKQHQRGLARSQPKRPPQLSLSNALELSALPGHHSATQYLAHLAKLQTPSREVLIAHLAVASTRFTTAEDSSEKAEWHTAVTQTIKHLD